MSRDYTTPATPVKLRPPRAGVSAPVYGLTTPPGWTPTERVRLAVARGLWATAERLAGVACRVAPGWRR